MDAEERAAAAQAAAAAADQVNDTVEKVSKVIRERVRLGLGVLGPAGWGPMSAVDATHTGVHAAIRGTTAALGTGAAQILAVTTPENAPTWSDDPQNAAKLAGMGAAFGDQLPEALAPRMRWRTDPDDVAMDRIAIFIHGLGGHDGQWTPDYAAAMRTCGFTPVMIRYTTGRPIHDNGTEFGTLVDGLVTDWPVNVSQIVIIAHSMGGLVTASAFTQATDDQIWPTLVSDVVTLGTPHKGAPLERFSDGALSLMKRFPAVAPIADLGHLRSQGIKDLAHGVEGPLPDHVHHHAVVGHLGPTQQHPKSMIIGDGMVLRDSAAGHAPDSDSVTVIDIAGTGHLTLLNHPRVTALLEQIGQALP